MPKAIVTVRELKNKDTGLDITIPTYKETPGLFASTIEFQVVVVTNLRCFKLAEHSDHDVVQFMVKKSQTELEQLYAKIEKNYPSVILPSLPKKAFLAETPAVEHKIAFEKFLQFLASSSKLCTCPVLLQFFGSDPMKSGSRHSRNDQGRPEALGEGSDIFEEARNEQAPSAKHDHDDEKSMMKKRPSIFDEESAAPDLFTGRDENDEFDLLSLAKAADKRAGAGGDGARSRETGETETIATETMATETRETTAAETAPRHADADTVKLFDELDYGGAVRKGDKSIFILPGSTSLDEHLNKLDVDDHDGLLDINDDVDSLFHVKKSSQPTKPTPAAKPQLANKPRPAAKPRPAVKPKPPAKSKPEVSVPEIGGSDDIMKYIRENTVDNDDVDLFS